MTVLVTGGLGLVGRSVVRNLLLGGHSVRIFDTPSAGTIRKLLWRLPSSRRKPLRRLIDAAVRVRSRSRVRREGVPKPALDVVRGDLCNIADVGEAVRGVDAVVHLGAIIPPAADRNPVRADYVNRGGTENLIKALSRSAPGSRFVFASSVAVYGDRRHNPQIGLGDEPNPDRDDHYAHQKLAAESALRKSDLDWTILRLTGISSPDKLRLDPLMFEMPPETKVEWCTAEDAGLALARAVDCREISRELLHLAGGPACRSSFRDYLDRQLELMGLGRGSLPPEAFGPGPFHCGYMDTTRLQELLHFQNHTLEDYYRAVERRFRWKRPFVRLLRRPLRSWLLRKSPYWRNYEASLPVRLRRRARFGLFVAGKQAHQPM